MTEETTVGPMTVGEVARACGVTVRTLHHYDRLGLVVPSSRSAAGYRLYSGADLDRLQHVVVLRRLEVPLEEIAALLESGDTVGRLRRQLDRVRARLAELEQLDHAIETALERAVAQQRMTDTEMRALFGDAFEDTYAEEAERRWGGSEAWRESQARTASYTREDWEAVKAEQDRVTDAFAEAMASGAPADSEPAMAAAEAHRATIERWFYACAPVMHRSMGALYADDARFAAEYEARSPGLAAYVRDAIVANGDRAGGATEE